MQETRMRSLVKTVVWRVIATAITLGAAYLLTDSLERATTIAFIGALLAMIAYYFHERLWNRISWGKR